MKIDDLLIRQLNMAKASLIAALIIMNNKDKASGCPYNLLDKDMA